MSAQPEVPSLTRIKQIATRRLFGLYDHLVPLFLDERVTIVHGANGVGKTVLLKLVHSLFSQDYTFLMSVPYEELIVTLVDGREVRVSQRRVEGRVNAKTQEATPEPVVTIATRSAADAPGVQVEIHPSQINYDRWAQQLTAVSPFVHVQPNDRFYDQRTEGLYSAEELWRLYGTEFADKIASPIEVVLPDELKKVLSGVKTYLVETQRLMRLAAPKNRMRRTEPSQMTSAVMADAHELGGRLRDAFSQYGRESQRLDQTFPKRLFELPQSMSREQIRDLLAAIERDQSRLADLGILDSQPAYPFSVSILDQGETAKMDAMELFVRDSKEKLTPLINFASRVEPLLLNINAKFKNKAIHLDREKGLVARASDGAEIRPDQLSSGEQHEMVLLFHLLFRVSPNTLVLVDEPELSLHIDWQRQVLPELLTIAGRSKIDALIATHSPFIAGERDELMINLDSTPD